MKSLLEKVLFRKIKTVKNPAQAGDAVLAFHYHNLGVVKLEINTQDHAPLYDKFFHGKGFSLSLWGASKGIKDIPLLKSGSFFDSLYEQNFTRDQIYLFTHVVLTQELNIALGKVPISESIEVTTYHLSDLDRNQIFTKGYY